jgi:hypothetical protein
MIPFYNRKPWNVIVGLSFVALALLGIAFIFALVFGIPVIHILWVLIVLVLALALWGRISSARERELKRSGSFALQFVLVADDGTAHELSGEQKAYLNTEFIPADGGRPYIKSRYSQVTPVGKIGGYLKRTRLPKGIIVQGSCEEL